MAAAGFAQWGNDLYTGRRSYDIVGHRRIWYRIAIGLVVICGVLLIKPGLNPGIEFRGGSEFVVSGIAKTDQQLAIDTVESIEPDEAPRVSTVGENSLRVQTATMTDEQVREAKAALATAFSVPEQQVTSTIVGPSWGKDVSSKAIRGLVVFLLLVAAVLTAYFRNWRMAVSAIVALFHDLIVTVGIYALIGWEVTPATVIGFLTVLAYSIYDTVVVFDKVRENTTGVLDQTRFTYAEKANLAVNQTLVRSINTSVVALLPVAAILFIGAFVLGAGTLRDISLALFVGMGVGAISSIFLATPIEVTLREREPKLKKHTELVLAKRAAAAAGGEPAAAMPHLGGQITPGAHQGVRAQPRKRR